MMAAQPDTLEPGGCTIVELASRWRDLLHQLVAEIDEPVLAVARSTTLREAVDAMAMGAVDVADLEHEPHGLAPAVLRAFARRSRPASSDRAVNLDALTPRQHEVLVLATSGMSSKQIAAALNLSKRTVDAHRRTMIRAADAGCFVDLIREHVRRETMRELVKPPMRMSAEPGIGTEDHP